MHGVRVREREERAVGRVKSNVQTAGYTSEVMLPQKAIFSSQAPILSLGSRVRYVSLPENERHRHRE